VKAKVKVKVKAQVKGKARTSQPAVLSIEMMLPLERNNRRRILGPESLDQNSPTGPGQSLGSNKSLPELQGHIEHCPDISPEILADNDRLSQ